VWIPKSEREILAAIEAGDLNETSSFDAKEALPMHGKSKDLAVDVAAMANDGGVLLYGVGEDEHGRPAIVSPIKLHGAKERVDQIVRTSISEPPTIEIHEIPAENHAEVGYLAVTIPSSSRAPHMVTVGKDHRFYGRSATGNVRLSEGDVARLYERRRRWEVDREKILDDAIAAGPIESHDDFAYLYLGARPVVLREDMLDSARGEQHVVQFLNGLFSVAVSEEVFPRSHGKGYSPDLVDNNSFERRADGWATSQGLGADWQGFGPGHALSLEIGLDGSGHLFCGRAAERANSGSLQFFEDLVAGLTARFLSVLGGLYAAGTYLGPVDVGIAVTGLEEAISRKLSQHLTSRHFLLPYGKNEYRRTERFSAHMLQADPRSAAQKSTLPLMRAITGEQYDPFAE
jgi:hypothetical protein